ncbi:MAG: hypothetical protein ACXABY_01520 [Candidatus Thorarchaeota archaeon]
MRVVTIQNSKLGSKYMSAHGRQDAVGHVALAAGVPKERLYLRFGIEDLPSEDRDKVFNAFPELDHLAESKLQDATDGFVGKERREKVRLAGREAGIQFRFIGKPGK